MPQSVPSLARVCLAVLLVTLWVAQPARALSLLRDADIEHALRLVAAPVLKVAGLGAQRLEILMVDDRSLNAFVVDRHHIFLHSGLIMKMDTGAMLQSVIAHEAAHITNGHLTRRPAHLRNARTAAGLGAVLAMAAAALSGQGELAGIGASMSSNAAMRLFFAHTRAEESAADQTAMRYLISAGIDPYAMVDVMDVFRGRDLVTAQFQDPYARTHPMSHDRFRVIKRLADANEVAFLPEPSNEYWFLRAQGKLSAFERAPSWTLNRLGETGFDDIAAMREAIAHHRQADTVRAVAAIDRAITLRPDDGFYYDLKGQILLEGRRFQAAVDAYAKAVELRPKNAMILGAYGRSLMTVGRTAEAIEYLQASHTRDGRDPRVMRDLARAYADQGDLGRASLATAERYAMVGRMKDAFIHSKRAVELLPHGSTAWRQAQDVLFAAETAKAQRKR